MYREYIPMAANTVTPAPTMTILSESILDAPPRLSDLDSGGPSLGSVMYAKATATRPIARIRTKTLLQPRMCDMNVPSGTPKTDEMLNPEKIHETALAL